jgi:hypothetical protein
MLLVTVSWYQHTEGAGFSLFTDTASPIEHADARWLPSLRKFMGTINAVFELGEACMIPLQRQNDQHLMDVAVRRPSTPQRLPTCLEVATMWDVVDGTGQHLIPDLAWGDAVLPHRDRQHRAHQTLPELFYWTCCQRLIRIVADRRGKVHTALGNWLCPSSKLRREWDACYDCRYHKLFLRQADQ